jgi:hypothetical protein
MKTPFYNQFRIYFAKVSAHDMGIDPQILYAEAFEKFIVGNIEEAKTGIINGACKSCGADLPPNHPLKK